MVTGMKFEFNIAASERPSRDMSASPVLVIPVSTPRRPEVQWFHLRRATSPGKDTGC
jgi:hypothetical protein